MSDEDVEPEGSEVTIGGHTIRIPPGRWRVVVDPEGMVTLIPVDGAGGER